MVEKNNGKLNMWVLAFTIMALLGIVAYFTFFNKDDIPEPLPQGTIYVTEVQLDKTDVMLNIGESAKLIATVYPSDATNKELTWSSNNESVVKVDSNGNITALSVGKAVITVKSADGKRNATCTVIVIDSENPVTNSVEVVGITLNNTNLYLLKGNSFKLLATISPADATNKNVTWTSSDSSVATVDENGNIMTKETGNAIITVKTKDGGKTAICHVIVTNEAVPVTSIRLYKNQLTMTKGESEVIGFGISPSNATDNNVIWTSSNYNVAKVDSNGKVTAVNAGKATITIRTRDGNKSDKCEVTVNNKAIHVEGISLNTEELTIPMGNSKTLTATITPANATNKSIKWKSSNPSVATVDSNGKVSGLSLGKSIVSAQTVDGKKVAKCEITVTR